MRKNYVLKRTASIVALSLLSLVSKAQVSAYAFTQSSGTYTPLASGTVVGTPSNDDQSFNANPIGFTFNYNGVDYTTFSIQSNGFIAMGSTVSSSTTAISSGSTNNIISALNGDLQGDGTTSKITYSTQGSAPDQVLIVEWTNYKHFGSGGSGDVNNFQIKLYETSNIIEIQYGNFTQNATSRTRQVGLRGASSADYNNRTTATDWSATAAGGTSAATCTLTSAIVPASGLIYRWTAPPQTPPTPTQAAGTPDCLTGTTLDVTGTPLTDVAWFWQSSASGTSMSDPYTGPYNVLANGTYYLRAYNTVANIWSLNSSSVVVSNFPVATTPPAPMADINPSCITTGTTLTMAAAPGGTEYYWQTIMDGTSNASPATVSQMVTVSGDYYVAAYEVSTGCWSVTNSLAVVVDNFIPAEPIGTPADYYVCTGATTEMIDATAANSGSVTVSSGTVNISIPDSDPAGVSSILNVSGIPAGATIATLSVTFNLTHTFDGDMDISLIGPNGMIVDLTSDNGGGGANFTNTTISSAGVTSITSGSAPFTGVFLPEGTMSNLYSIPNGDYTFFMVDDAGGDLGVLLDWSITIDYTLPLTTVDWYDMASGGTNMGSGSPFESVGTMVLPGPAPAGVYSFFAESVAGACVSASRTELIVYVSDVNVTLDPIAVTCNNGNDGSFMQSAVQCGSAPFTYSVDGGAFGAIPTNLTVGDHSVIVQDASMGLSGVYTVTVGDAMPPSSLMVDAFNNDQVDISWTAGGTETQWYVEWGMPGFTPGTGSALGTANAMSPAYSITGLDGYTTYDFYVAANCGSGTTAGDWIFISQMTLCDPFVAQGFCESFDSDSETEECWTVFNTNGDADSWNMNYTTNPYSGDQTAMLYTDGNGGANDDWLISPMLTLTNNEILSFYYRVNSSTEPNDFEVLLSTSGMAPSDFTEVLMANYGYSNTTYADSTIDLSAYSGDCFIAFHVPAGGLDGWRLYIDQVCVDICIPTPGVDGSTDVCRADSNLDLDGVITAGEPNGVWSFPANPGLVSGSNLNVGLLPDGTYTTMYVVTTACTMDTTYATVNVHSSSQAGTSGSLDDYCTNWTGINLFDGLSGTIDLGGSWTNVSGEGTVVGNQWNPAVTTVAGAYDFEYVVNNGFCPNDTATVTVNLISCLGIDDNGAGQLAIYPNPVTSNLTIQNVEVESAVLDVLDAQGKVVRSVVLNNVYGNYVLDMSDLQRGMYLVRMTTEAGITETRVVKQ